LSYNIISGSNGSISVFDLSQGGVAAEHIFPTIARSHWSSMIDENTFLVSGLNSDCSLIDIRALNRIQRKFSFGPVKIPSSGAVSFHGQYLALASDSKKPMLQCFDISDQRNESNKK
jgi:hypothetical protein